MNILLKTLKFVNFKGLKDFTLDFDQTVTSIHGDNGTCKTTLFDGFTWLLFGKDSFDRKDFNIKTLDENNNPIPKLEHEVSGVLDVDGKEISLRRVLKEKWTKRRGSEDTEFTGNETEFYWNDVPVSAGDYQKRVSGILQESVFKLITNPLYFNSLKWQDRRSTLIELAGGINDTDVATGNQAYIDLLASIAGRKTLAEYKIQIANQKKGIKQQLEQIPTRIDELVRNTPAPIDYAAIEKEIGEKEAKVKELDGQLSDLNAAYEAQNTAIREKQNQVFKFKTRQNQIEFELKTKAQKEANEANQSINEAKQNLANIRSSISLKTKQASDLNNRITELNKEIETLNKEIEALRVKWNDENAGQLVFDANEFVCPACKREFEASDIEAKKGEMLVHFNEHKQAQLTAITANGQQKNKRVSELTKQVEELNKQHDTLNEEIKTLESAELGLKDVSNETPAVPADIKPLLSANEEYQKLSQDIATIETEIAKGPEKPDTTTINQAKQLANNEIIALRSKLSVKEAIERAEKRKSELLSEEKKYAQQLSDLEGIEFTIDSFNKAKINLVESRVNGKFSIVKFKLFDTQINGGEVECCEALVNGVPYNDGLNKGMTISAGLDIINTLCGFYGVTAPIWTDNCESVTELIPTASQLIRLVVEKYSPLTIK